MLSRVLRFGVVGVLTAGLHYGLLLVGVELLQLDAIVASSLGFVVAVLFNYVMHYSWTFTHDAPHGRTVGRYGIMISIGFAINGGAMYAGLYWLVWNYLLVQALALLLVVSWNFIVSNIWVFKP